MRKYTADYIFNSEGKLVTDHMLVTDDRGTIIELVKGNTEDAAHYHGILTPGFINTHCHLELSHLKNKIEEGKGLDGFIKDIIKVRNCEAENIGAAVADANRIMWENGIQAVGDICNTIQTFEVKKTSPVRYHNFIEVFNFRPEEAIVTFENGTKKYNAATASQLNATIIPHAPYSVTPQLFNLIKLHHDKAKSPWCIHNQECSAENELFQTGSGALWNCFTSMGIDMSWLHPTKRNSLQTISSYFPEKANLLFVHNTFTSKSDIEFLKSVSYFNKSWFCICAKANLFIEKKLPEINMLNDSGCKITIGTDSLASNNTLSILEELKTIHRSFTKIPIETLLTWATINGADYFGWNDLGSFKKNASPGILLISKSGPDGIRPDSEVTRIC